MEIKVTINNQLGMRMVIAQEFTSVVDTEEEAETFGEEISKLSTSFMNGYSHDDS
jgi:hypothetical protein